MASIPDTETFPHATGLALKTVEARSQEQDLVLWGAWFCPFVQRVGQPLFQPIDSLL